MKTKPVYFWKNFSIYMAMGFGYGAIVLGIMFFIMGPAHRTLAYIMPIVFVGFPFAAVHFIIARTKLFDYEIKNHMMPIINNTGIVFPMKKNIDIMEWDKIPDVISTVMVPVKTDYYSAYSYCHYTYNGNDENRCLVHNSSFVDNLKYIKDGKLFGDWRLKWSRNNEGPFVEAMLVEPKKQKKPRNYKKEYKS